MSDYEDDTIVVDDDGLTIRSYGRPGHVKRIEFSAIRGFETFPMGFWSGRHRLVGMPLGRPRNWFHWDRHRRGKQVAIGLDVGGWIRPTIAPADPETVEQLLRRALDQA